MTRSNLDKAKSKTVSLDNGAEEEEKEEEEVEEDIPRTATFRNNIIKRV